MLTRVTFYTPEGEEETDIEYLTSGDYACVALYDKDGKRIVEFGDYYHDKGQEKMEGFVAGMAYSLNVSKLVVKDKNAITAPYDYSSTETIPEKLY